MSWVDYDYLADGVGKARKLVRERILALEAELDIDTDAEFPPPLLALYTIDEGALMRADDDNRSVADRLVAAREAVAAVEALPDAALGSGPRLLLTLDLEMAIAEEERNNNPQEPFVPR